MLRCSRTLTILLPAALGGCLSAPLAEDLRRIEDRPAPPAADGTVPLRAAAVPEPGPEPPPALSRPIAPPSAGGRHRRQASPPANLAETVDLRTLIDEALARNPELREADERTRAAVAGARGAASLDEPFLKVETWAVPLRKPLAFDQAENNMFGLMQTFPFPGKLGLRAEAAVREAEAVRQIYLANERDVIARLKRAYFEYYMLSRERDVHLEHVRILEDFERITDAKYRTGTVPQQDVLKAQLELVMLHSDLLVIEQRLGSAAAVINVLIDRPAGAPLGKPRDIALEPVKLDLGTLEDRAAASRPELEALRLRLQASEAGAALAKRDALLPDFTVGADYWQINGGDDAWGGFVSINLPWLSGKRASERRRMEHAARADAIVLERGRKQVFFEVRDAYLKVEAAQGATSIITRELLPKSSQAVEVTRASYVNDRASFLDLLDAERSRRDVQLKHYRALAEYEAALADLERAVGVDLGEQP